MSKIIFFKKCDHCKGTGVIPTSSGDSECKPCWGSGYSSVESMRKNANWIIENRSGDLGLMRQAKKRIALADDLENLEDFANKTFVEGDQGLDKFCKENSVFLMKDII